MERQSAGSRVVHLDLLLRSAGRACGVSRLEPRLCHPTVRSASLGSGPRWMGRGALGRAHRRSALVVASELLTGLLQEIIAALDAGVRRAGERDAHDRPRLDVFGPQFASVSGSKMQNSSRLSRNNWSTARMHPLSPAPINAIARSVLPSLLAAAIPSELASLTTIQVRGWPYRSARVCS